MPQRVYYFPIVHCPSLCPFEPPAALYGDDYDPAREEAVWKFCGDHCWLSREFERPCLTHAREPQTRSPRAA